MSPGAGSGAVPGERSLPAVCTRCRAGREGRGGRDLCPAGPGGMRGTGEGAAAVLALSLAPRFRALPGNSSRCLVSHVLPRGRERGIGAPSEWEGSFRVGRVWAFPGSSPAPLPRILGPGVRSPEREAGCCGRGCSRAGLGSPLCPGPAESTAGLCRSRQGYVGPGRASRLPFLWPVPPPRVCLGPGGAS